MSSNLPLSAVKAPQRDYNLPIKHLWIETWRQLVQMPKAFWQGFGLMLLTLLATTVFIEFLYRWYDLGLMHFQNHQAQLPNLQVLHYLNQLKILLSNIVTGIEGVLRALLTVSLAFLALMHIRKQPIKATGVFVFLKNWAPLLLLSLFFYLLTRIAIPNFIPSLFFLFRNYFSNNSIFLFEVGLFLFILLNAYCMAVTFMAGLLILDQNLSFRNSLSVAFKSINRHVLKNITLLFLASWAYINAQTSLINLLFSGYKLYFCYLFLLPGLALAILFTLYKTLAHKNKPSLTKNVILIGLNFILGLLIVILIFLGASLIWLLPMIAVLLALQYQHIFLDSY